MKKIALAAIMIGTTALEVGCANESHEAFCGDVKGGVICAPEGVPEAKAAVAISNDCEGEVNATCSSAAAPTKRASLSQPEAGTLCLKGSIETHDGEAWLLIAFNAVDKDRYRILTTFDAESLGITKVAFNVDQPPAGGVSVHAHGIRSQLCMGDPTACLTSGFDLLTAPHAKELVNITESGPHVAPFANFEGSSGSGTLDTSALGHLYFRVGFGDYDFCVSDLKFLDDEDNEVAL